MPSPQFMSCQGSSRVRQNGLTAALESGSRAAEGVFGQALGDDVVGLVERVGAVEKAEIARADRAVFDQRVEINHFVPVFGAKQHDRHAFARFARLYQGQDLEQLVERAIAARKQYDRLGEVDKPELAHEKIMKIEVQLRANIRVVKFLVRDRDGQPDIEPLRLGSAAIGC